MLSPAFIAKAKPVKLMIFDVDGIFTNGIIYVDDHGIETKAFHVLDGQGIKFLHQTGIQTAVISGRKSPGVQHRLDQLGIHHIYLGYPKKLPIYQELLQQLQLSDQQVAYAGDDLLDLPLLTRVGLPITVPNAVIQVQQLTPFITQNAGGKGAVREICEGIMMAQNTWSTIINEFLP